MVIAYYDFSSLEVIVLFCDYIIHTISFLLCGAPFPLCVCEGMWKKSNWEFCSIIFPWQLCSTGIIWCICVYCVMFCWIWILQYSYLDNWLLACVKKALWWVGVHLNFACWQVKSVKCLAILVPDKLSIVSNESKKWAYLFECFQWMHVLYGLSLWW